MKKEAKDKKAKLAEALRKNLHRRKESEKQEKPVKKDKK
jgi:hypothetical protein